MSNANPYQPKTYTKVQLIAYQVPTLALTQPAPALTPPMEAVKSIPDADARNRVQRLLGVLDWARRTIPGNLVDFHDPLTQSNTLKVFIAPEFYFRGTDARGYSFGVMQNILDCLKTAVQKDGMLWDWLIVPGTICSWQPVKNPQPNQPIGTFFNTACAIKGGPNAPFTYIHKEFASDIDGVPAHINDAGNDPKFQPILESWTERKSHIFQVDNVTFGMEVCLDHGTGVLKRVVLDWSANEHNQPAPPIDVQLITSCGMEVMAESVVARTNGGVLLCDGVPNSSPPWERSTVRRVQVQNLTANGVATLSKQSANNAVNLTTPVWQQNVPNNLAIARGNVANADWFTQKVVCYPAFTL